MKKHGAIIGLAFLPVAILSVGCGQTKTTDDPQILAQRAKYVLAAEPQGAISVVEARTTVEKGEPIVLAGRIDAGGDQPWDEGQAAFFITDVAAASHGDHQHSQEAHTHDSDPADHKDAHSDDHDHGHAEEHEAHDDGKGGKNGNEAHGHDHDDTHDHEHASGDEHEHEAHEEAHKHDHGDVHSAHSHPGHNHEDCAFCARGKSQTDSLAVVEFLDEQGKRLPIDARELLGVKRDQEVVVRGRGKINDLGYLIIAAEGIYIRE